MIEVVRLKRFKGLLAFMRFPAPKGAFFRALEHRLRHGSGAGEYLFALRGGRPVMRVCASRRAKEVQLSLFEADDDQEAAEALFRAVEENVQGSIVGPVPHDRYAFCYGLPLNDAAKMPPLLTKCPPYYAKLFKCAGYGVYEDFLCYRAALDDIDADMLARAGSRFRGNVMGTSPRALASIVQYVLSLDGEAADTSALREAISKVRGARRAYLLTAKADGHFVGYLLAQKKGKEIHVFSAHVAKEARMRGAFAALAAALIAAAKRDGVKTVRAAVISDKNMLSRTLAERLGGQIEQIYRIFQKK